MRGLASAATETTRARGTSQAVITAVAVFTALALFVSACATGGTGARDEGPAHDESVAGAAVAPTASPAPSSSGRPGQAEVVRLIQADPLVSTEVKRDLKPCAADDYAIDTSYGDLTGGTAEDVVVNVLTCGDGVGVGSYVYREQNGSYENVFQAEEPPVYAQIDRGDLVVSKQVYEKGDPVSNPSGENVITYRWNGSRFAQEYFWHNDYGTVVEDTPSPVPEA
ncbi:Lipoprotein CseA [Streptomyces davaonensis JCM 4913]|uniref:Lipoprotein CseA n=1 Tax=Streptomyces davaonensis (strain DSM 101723 / JCM 4913 / KCC S-0913 / 768) TaxID=1214101 RepID=K4R5R6_STRDJ|nr:hypothetical protein [Streptomyces davaonensis]CCK28400.1 Lipoprotein CseA [Streptomyces davaonensis JCM 4913]